MRNDGLNVYKVTDTVVPIVFKEIYDKPITKTIVLDDLKTGTTKIDAGAVFGISSGMGKLMKTAKVYEEVDADATSIKVYNDSPGHQFKAGDFIAYNDVSTEIVSVTVGDDYDTIVVTATLDATEAIPVSSVLYLGGSETTNTATESAATVEDTAADYLEIANPRGTTNDIIVTISQAGDDTLAVTYTPSTKTLAIALAKTTASNNNAAAIQAAIRALAQSGGVDFTDWTATGTGWDGGQTGATLTDPSHRMSDGVPKAAYIAPAYTDLVLMHQKVEFDLTEDANVSGGMLRRCVVDESNMPYPIPTAYKALLTDRVRFE